jgi:hypothetical protein
MDDYSFISEFNGELYLEPENYNERTIRLGEVFNLYSDPDKESSDVARMLGIDKKDITNAVFYWTEQTDVYMELAANSPEEVAANQDNDSESCSLQTVSDIFYQLGEREETHISEEDIESDVEESFFSAVVDEVCVEWERDGSDLGLYAGQRGDDVLISYSVDGDAGEVLQVEEEQIGDLLEEMYTNAVFGSKT